MTIRAFVARDKFNQETYVDHEVFGRFKFQTKFVTSGVTIVTVTGQQVLSTAMAYFSWDIDQILGRHFIHEDRVLFESILYVPLKILGPKSFSDPHYEIFFA